MASESDARIVVSLFGGLGNQMFQYAAGRALAHRLGLPLALELRWFDDHGADTKRGYGLSAFPIAATIMDATEIAGSAAASGRLARLRRRLASVLGTSKIVVEPSYHYWPGIEKLEGSVLLQGYWQSPIYFEAIGPLIRSDFAFPPLPAGGSRDIARRIEDADCAVSVHVRRGDFLSNADNRQVHRCCAPAYYRQAFDLLASRHWPMELFVFGDDPDWARSEFGALGHRVHVVDVAAHRDAPHHDMHLMTLADHHIIANSSFSWWAAWLDPKPDKQVIAPRLWFSREVMRERNNTVDLFPDGWITI